MDNNKGVEEVVNFLEDIILVIVFFEHLCFVVLGVTGTEGKGFLELGSWLAS
jgi:hypothetical protein